jgi:hypothetical protein
MSLFKLKCMCLFVGVIAVAFQSVFNIEIHQNNFLFKINFKISVSNDSKYIKKLIFIFLKKNFYTVRFHRIFKR